MDVQFHWEFPVLKCFKGFPLRMFASHRMFPVFPVSFPHVFVLFHSPLVLGSFVILTLSYHLFVSEITLVFLLLSIVLTDGVKQIL